MGAYKIKGLANSNGIQNSGYRIKDPVQSNDIEEEQPTQEQESGKTGIGSIPGDLAEMMTNLFMSGGEKAIQLPEEIESGLKPFSQQPGKATVRAGGNILSSLLEGGKQAYNFPLNLNTYLGSKGIFPFKQTSKLAEKLKIGDTGLEKYVLGEPQEGDQLFKDIGTVVALIGGPKGARIKVPSVTAKGITKDIVKTKVGRMAEAKEDYNKLFEEASKEGLTHAVPSKSVIDSEEYIVEHSQPKFHESLQTYIGDPTIENAHWAQSELGALERHLDNISKKTGLTPSQIKTYKQVKQARKDIKDSMFSKNSLGANPELSEKYNGLSNKYREEVVPYTSLEDISEFQQGNMRPKTVVKNLQNNEEFMTKLAKEYPGLKLYTPVAKRTMLGLLGLMGYDEVKKLLKTF